MKATAGYAVRALAAALRQPSRALELALDYPRWRRSLGSDGMRDGAPWITFAARRFVEPRLPGAAVFEYGAGGSTLWLAGRAARVVSVEHHRDWAERVRTALGARANVDLRTVPPEDAAPQGDPADPASFATSDPDLRTRSFRAYACAIDPFPDASFDLVLVDGRARPSCVARALPKVKPGGALLLDDSFRPHYARACDLLGGWQRHDFRGPLPYLRVFSQTTVWIRPAQEGGAEG